MLDSIKKPLPMSEPEPEKSMSFDEALPFLQKQIAKTFEGPDAKEGIAAFLEKRDPNWD